MALKATEHIFTGPTTPYTSYDATKTNLGLLIQQKTGLTATDKFAGPMPVAMARPMEASTSIAVAYPHVLQYDNDVQWIFLIENSTAAPTRRIVKYTYTISTGVFTWDGFITLTFPTATNHTVRGFRMSREFYTTGTASVSGTAVTGVGTTWSTDRLSVGTRIGFGSTDPTQITTWHQISAIGSNTSITLTASAGTIASGPYVIEDLMAVVSTTNATTTNGGLFVAKGLREVIFTPSGTTIPAATTVDNIRAVYWLADASTVTNITADGVALESFDNWGQQFVYVIDGTASTKVYKYNIRTALASIVAGKSVSAYVLTTGTQTPTGTVSQLNNGRIGTLLHGPGNGVESLYFATTTRVYRAALSAITSGNVAWQSDAMVEVPPGGTATYPATGVLSSVEISDQIDRLVVMSTGTAGARSYVTRYNTNSDPFDHIFTSDDKQLDQSFTDSGSVTHPAISALPFSVWSESGILYMCRLSTVLATNQLYAIPIGAHWTYAGQTPEQRLITPSMQTTNAVSFSKVYVNSAGQLGDGTLGLPTEPYRLYYRTSGITDDTGTWIAVDDSNDISGAVPGVEIQFMFEFRILGTTCIPARIYSISVVYEDNTTDSHYQPSVANSSITAKTFAWRFSTAFGGTVPTLNIKLFDSVTGGLILSDDTATPTAGTWEKSTDGGSSWVAYNTADKANETTYIRYTPTTLGDNIRVRALLTQ